MLKLSSRFLLPSLLALGLWPAAVLAQYPNKLVEVKTSSNTPRFSVDENGAVLGLGEYGDNNGEKIPLEGAGTRLLWYPGKAAFRAGSITGTQWDAANIGDYSVALGYNARTLGDYGLAAGKDVVAANVGTVALGEFCTATGANSVALGYYAHTSTSQGSPRLGTFVFSDRSVVDDGSITTDEAFHAQVTNSAHWRVANGFRIFTNSALTTGVTIQNGSATSNWGQGNAVISTSTGAYLSTTGVWANSSDRRKKHRFEPVAGEDVLRRLRQVPITRWSYKTDPAAVRHLGPMAQDFRRAFGLGQDSTSIGTVDADGVALAAAQALEARTTAQAAQLRALQAENAELRARLGALEQRAGLAGGPSSFAPASLPLAALLLGGAGLGAVLLRRRR